MNLRHAIAGGEKDESVHFLMVPRPREELIDTEIERAVSRLQSVIELGRVSRDKRTLPVKVSHLISDTYLPHICHISDIYLSLVGMCHQCNVLYLLL